MSDIYDRLIEHGITYDRLKSALDSRDNWGAMVHAFEYLETCGLVLACWPEDKR